MALRQSCLAAKSGACPSARLDEILKTGDDFMKNTEGVIVSFAAVLRGRRVLEIAGGLAGEHCGHALAGLGAEVLAVRSAQPPRRRPLDAMKRIVDLDPQADDGFDTLARLAEECELVIEDRPPPGWAHGGPLSKRLLQGNPRLIAVCLSPFGLSGPHADYAAYPLNCYHAGGHAQQIPCDALRPQDRTRAPLQAGAQWGEAQAGTMAAIAALASLLDGEHHAGKIIDCSKQEALISYNWTDVARYPNEGRSPTRLAPLATIVGGILPTTDGFVEVAVREDHQWTALASLLAHPGWADDPRFATRAARSARWHEVAGMLASETRKFPTRHLHINGRELGIPIAAVMSLRALLGDADLAARDAWVESCAGPGDGESVRLARWDSSVSQPGATAKATTSPEPGGSKSTGVGRGSPGRPLQGLRVLDLGWVAMGPYAGYLFSCLGAEVIHVARPRQGGQSGVDRSAYNYGFDTLNTGKTWVDIDLKRREGVGLVRSLAARCDIVLENFRPGVSDRLGVGYADLSKANPRLVMVSASTYGQRDMGGAYVGYAPVFSALAGLGYLTGYPDGPPVEVSTPVDFFAGSVGVFGVLAGLHRLAASGIGCHIDLSAREAILWSLANEMAWIQTGRRDGGRIGNAHPEMAPHGVYRCRGENRWLSIAIGSDAEWQRLCRCIGTPGLAEDARFLTLGQRLEHRVHLDELLERWTQAHDTRELSVRLQACAVAAFPSATSEDLWNDPHLQTRGVFQSRQTAGGERWYVAPPWHHPGQSKVQLDNVDGTAALHAVFSDLLGLQEDAIAALRRDGVIAARQERAEGRRDRAF